MPQRKGLGKGLGKGYKNITQPDPAVHSMSARGVKQQQSINPIKPMKSAVRLKPRDQLVIKGRKWFDRVNGNTYHSVEVYLNGKLIGRNPFEYGYGDQYRESAKNILAEKGYIVYERTKELVPVKNRLTGKVDYHTPKESINKRDAYSEFSDWERKHMKQVLYFVDDVSKRSDL